MYKILGSFMLYVLILCILFTTSNSQTSDSVSQFLSIFFTANSNQTTKSHALAKGTATVSAASSWDQIDQEAIDTAAQEREQQIAACQNNVRKAYSLTRRIRHICDSHSEKEDTQQKVSAPKEKAVEIMLQTDPDLIKAQQALEKLLKIQNK